MNRKAVSGMIAVLLISIWTLTPHVPPVKSEPIERKVGVNVGDWAKYDWNVTWSSDNPSPPKPEPPPWVFEVEWLMNTVQTIIETEITFQFLIHLENGTDITQTLSIDIDTGYGMGPSFFISADLNAGDSMYTSPPWNDLRINKTISRTYAGITRDTNHLNGSWTMDYTQDYVLVSYFEAYWDKTTGVLCEYESLQTFTHKTKGYVTSELLVLKLIETNIWGPIKTLLGTGWGWMRIDVNESVYGRAELYKIGDEQIELVITSEGEEYSRTWNIIFHKEYKYGERYLCYSKERGFLIVGLHKHRRWQFWYAVGKGVTAFGFPRFGRLRLML